MEKKFKGLADIPGVLPSYHNAQLLVSSGIASLDELIGDGIPIGTVCIIEEDLQGVYSKTILKYFLAEGIANKHATLTASLDVNPKTIINHLPALITNDAEPETQTDKDDKMKIAFRYHNLPTSEKQSSHKFEHYYDLSRNMRLDEINQTDVSFWNGSADLDTLPKVFQNPAYHDLLETIKEKLKVGKFLLNDTPNTRSVLKIGIHSLGSPMWFTEPRSAEMKDLNLFFFCLRALMRSAFAVALVTVPSHLYEKGAFSRCIHCSDIAIRLETFAGTELEQNHYLTDYHGFFHLEKLAAINTFASKHPGSVEYAFKLRRKKFVIEKLHLPPNIESAKTKTKPEAPTMGCGSSDKHLLEF